MTEPQPPREPDRGGDTPWIGRAAIWIAIAVVVIVLGGCIVLVADPGWFGAITLASS